MTQLTHNKAQVLAKDHGIEISKVRSVHNDIFTDGIAIGDLFFKSGTTMQHAKMVLECIGKSDEVSRATLAYHKVKD